MQKPYLRKANQKDMDLLFAWANDSEVRKNSFNTAEIKYDEHKEWFNKCLADPNIDIYILCINDIPVGQIRMNYENETGLINYSIQKDCRGKGLGGTILKLIETSISVDRPEIKVLSGWVKTDNIASQKKFEENGYKRIHTDEKYLVFQKWLTNQE